MLDSDSASEDEAPAPKMGRPTKYKPEFAAQAEKLCKLGATDVDMADFFGVSIRTVERWRAEHEDFCRAITMAKEEADNRVERSLYQKAVGYTYDAVKLFQYEGTVVEAPYREHVPPDTASAIFWLKNRRKDQWRDRVEQEHTHTHTFSAQFEDFIRQLNARKHAPAVEIEAETVEVEKSISESAENPGLTLLVRE